MNLEDTVIQYKLIGIPEVKYLHTEQKIDLITQCKICGLKKEKKKKAKMNTQSHRIKQHISFQDTMF